MVLSVALTSSAWALPWATPMDTLKPQLTQKSQKSSLVNFSGLWTGSCDFVPAADMTIKHEGNQVSISYGTTEEKYVIGEMKSSSSAQASGLQLDNTYVNLDSDRQALIFVTSTSFKNSQINFISFFNKITMVLDGDRLAIKAQYFHSDANMGDVAEEGKSCVYRLKRN